MRFDWWRRVLASAVFQEQVSLENRIGAGAGASWQVWRRGHEDAQAWAKLTMWEMREFGEKKLARPMEGCVWGERRLDGPREATHLGSAGKLSGSLSMGLLRSWTGSWTAQCEGWLVVVSIPKVAGQGTEQMESRSFRATNGGQRK